jgi:hypothetical protein
MTLIETTHWYVRKRGWTQGPFTREQIRQMYATSLISRIDRVANSQAGPWLPLHAIRELGGEQEPTLLPHESEDDWEIASPGLPRSQPVSFGMLQMLAASGKLAPADLVRRLGDVGWRPASDFPGIFGGPRGWCTACGAAIEFETRTCPTCSAHQPAFEPSMASFALTCGAVAWIWTIVATASVVSLALRRFTILGVAVDEHFPQVFAVVLAPAALLVVWAIILGRVARTAVREGRSAPVHLSHAVRGEWLGWTACLLLALVVVAVTAFSVAHFRLET